MSAAFVAASSASLSAAVLLTGATNFGTDPSGTYANGFGITATSGCCQVLSIENGSIGSGAVGLPLTLNTGTTYTLFFETGSYGPGFAGLNLFFDSSTTPGISVFAATTGDKTVFNAYAADGNNTASLSNTVIPGSGSLTYTSGATTVTLTSYQSVIGGGTNPYTIGQDVERVVLEVTDTTSQSGVPEPSTFLISGLGLAGVLFSRLRLRK